MRVSSIVPEGDEPFILERIRNGEAVLILGAGASKGCTNRSKTPVKDSGELAQAMVESLGYVYSGESLLDAVSAYEDKYGTEPLHILLRKEFKRTEPSTALKALFRYVWARAYTWNIDDSVKEAARGGVQRPEYYNGIVDRVEAELDPTVLQTVFLHGDIWKPEYGFIFSRDDYAAQLVSGRHYWYQQLAQDCRAFTPIFIGSSLSEPILDAELARLSRHRGGSSGQTFLVVPDQLTDIQRGSFAKRQIVQIQATLEQFVNYLASAVGPSISVEQVIGLKNQYSTEDLKALSSEELTAAYSLYAVRPRELQERLYNLPELQLQGKARRYLLGSTPDWLIAASRVPVRLEILESLKDALRKALGENSGIFTVIGQAGSGKTTGLMQAVLELATSEVIGVYELSIDAPSVRKAIQFLARLDKGSKIVFLRDLFVFGPMLADDLEFARRNGVLFVSSARSSEWAEYLSYHFGASGATFEFERFGKVDHDPLIDRLVEFVPAPAFRKLSRDDQRKRLRSSRSQLLIALRQATDSQNFDETVIGEYDSLPDQDTKNLFLLVGIATLARVGIRPEVAAEAYESLETLRSYSGACNALSGIVSVLNSGRLAARHEFYVRKIIERKTDFADLARVIKAVLNTYLKFEIPISRYTSRSDSILFRFLFNHDFLMEMASISGDKRAGLQIYRAYELQFQLDGHFWLQYGLYMADVDSVLRAMPLMERSLQAYPGNEYTKHALADLQLRAARDRPVYDHETRRLLNQAVKQLLLMDANPQTSVVQFPIITLAFGHVGALIRHRRESEAKTAAKQYFDRLSQLEKTHWNKRTGEAKEALFRYVTLGQWGKGSH